MRNDKPFGFFPAIQVYAILADPEAFTGKRYEARKDTTELLCRVEKHPENDPLQSDVGRMGIYRSAAGS